MFQRVVNTGWSVYEAVHSLWSLSLLLSDRLGGLHGLAFSLCRSSLKPNTGTRSHLPSMAQMPSTIPVPCCHKTEAGHGVMIEFGAIAPGLRRLHNFRSCWRASGWRGTSRHTIKAHLHLFDQRRVCIVRWAMTSLKPGDPSLSNPTHCACSPTPVLRIRFQRSHAVDSRYSRGGKQEKRWVRVKELLQWRGE